MYGGVKWAMIIVCNKGNSGRTITRDSSGSLVLESKEGESAILLRECSHDYDAAVMPGGEINVFAVSESGTLYRIRCSKDETKATAILDSREAGKKIGALRCLALGGTVHLFYCVESKARYMLVHHILSGDSVAGQPRVLDYIGAKCCYGICSDDSYNINILYVDESEKLKCVTYKNSQKTYAASVTQCGDTIRALCPVVHGDSLYAAYLSRTREYNVINVLRLSDGVSKTVGFGVDLLSEPCMFEYGDGLCVQWCEKGYAFECRTENDMEFCKPVSLGKSLQTAYLRSEENGRLGKIDKCAVSASGSIYKSALSAFESACGENRCKTAGEEVAEYAERNLKSMAGANDSDDEYSISKRLSEIESRLDEISEYLMKNVMSKGEKTE